MMSSLVEGMTSQEIELVLLWRAIRNADKKILEHNKAIVEMVSKQDRRKKEYERQLELLRNVK